MKHAVEHSSNRRPSLDRAGSQQLSVGALPSAISSVAGDSMVQSKPGSPSPSPPRPSRSPFDHTPAGELAANATADRSTSGLKGQLQSMQKKLLLKPKRKSMLNQTSEEYLPNSDLNRE